MIYVKFTDNTVASFQGMSLQVVQAMLNERGKGFVFIEQAEFDAVTASSRAFA